MTFYIYVYYIGKDRDKLSYGQECILDYYYNTNKNIEYMGIYNLDHFDPIMLIENEGIKGSKSHNELFEQFRKDFVYQEEWDVIKVRYERLDELLID